VVLILASRTVLGQDGQATKFDENDVIFLQKLLSASSNEQESLLKGQSGEFNLKIWKGLIDRALYIMDREKLAERRRICFVAMKVAESLGDHELIALTWYHLGNIHSSYDLNKAIEYYSHSYNQFLYIGYWNDLVYICAELASLHILKQELTKAKIYADEA